MARSSCFGSTLSNLRTCHTRFPFGSPIRLTSLLKVTRWPIIQKVRSHTLVLLLLVRTRFQILFTPLTEVLFAFPSRYWFTIGHSVVFSLRGWSPYLQTGYHVSRSTLFSSSAAVVYVTITLFRLPSQIILLTAFWLLGFCSFVRHYSRNLVWFLFLGLLRCFTSPGSPLINTLLLIR